MIYRGKVSDGVVVLEGERPRDGTIVRVIPVEEDSIEPATLASHPAVGIWKDRADLPADTADAKRELGRRLMGRPDD